MNWMITVIDISTQTKEVKNVRFKQMQRLSTKTEMQESPSETYEGKAQPIIRMLHLS